MNRIYIISYTSTFNDEPSELSNEILGVYNTEEEAIESLNRIIQKNKEDGVYSDDDILKEWRDSVHIVTDRSSFLYEIHKIM